MKTTHLLSGGLKKSCLDSTSVQRWPPLPLILVRSLARQKTSASLSSERDIGGVEEAREILMEMVRLSTVHLVISGSTTRTALRVNV